uniref:Uncharacterized protein n=1 Tax=uncultured Rhodospirillales bacterium HF0200_01O14 TaxID=710787 RepID=E0XTV3_9PROT|nr:hypothetical protein [uncultured Rhodospirillales bacterium HF0200_01O14]
MCVSGTGHLGAHDRGWSHILLKPVGSALWDAILLQSVVRGLFAIAKG